MVPPVAGRGGGESWSLAVAREKRDPHSRTPTFPEREGEGGHVTTGLLSASLDRKGERTSFHGLSAEV